MPSLFKVRINMGVHYAERQHVDPASAAESLDAIAKRLRVFKRKVEEGLVEEESHTERCRQRLEHIDDVCVSAAPLSTLTNMPIPQARDVYRGVTR